MRIRHVPALAAVLLTAACASSTPAAAPAVSETPTLSATAAPTSASPTPVVAPSASRNASKILLSTQARTLPPGPFRITPVSCGAYTPAEQAKFGTNAKGGLIYRYTNVSNSLTGAPALTVDFLNGSDVLGANVTGNAPDIGPGQSAEGHVDALDGSGQNLTFTGCELMQYGLRGMGAGSNFAP